jgi:hypothetical protein
MKRITDYEWVVIRNSIQYLTVREIASALHFAQDSEAEHIIVNCMMKPEQDLYDKETKIYDFDKDLSKKNYEKLIESLDRSVPEVVGREYEIENEYWEKKHSILSEKEKKELSEYNDKLFEELLTSLS